MAGTAAERGNPLPAAQRAEQYAALESAVRGLIAHVGDTSGLILDPDLDSYYLMDATLVALPQTQTRLRQIRRSYREVDLTKPLDVQKREEAAIFAAQLQEADVDRLTGDFDTCFKEDPHFNGISPTLQPQLRPVLQRYVSSNQALLAQMQAFRSQSSDANHLHLLEGAIDQAVADSYALESASLDKLDKLLEARISGRCSDLGRGLASMLGAIFCSGSYA